MRTSTAKHGKDTYIERLVVDVRRSATYTNLFLRVFSLIVWELEGTRVAWIVL